MSCVCVACVKFCASFLFLFSLGFFPKKDFGLVFSLEGEGEYEQSSIGGILSYLSFDWEAMSV